MNSSRLFSGLRTLFLVLLLAVSTVSAAQVSWTKSGLLYSGQGNVHRNRGWHADSADTDSGSDGYVGISSPQTGATYYAQVYAKQGSGTYTLTCQVIPARTRWA